MFIGTREDNIRRIISMEDRIMKCNRCPELQRCIRKPDLGKGDLEPEAILVFESANYFTADMDNIIKIRQSISTEFGIDKIYHTFLVRCQPKACHQITNTNSYGNSKLVDKNYNCILNNKLCSGIPIRPTDVQIVSCLSYTIEEIEILNPLYLFLFGERVAEYLLKSWGIFGNYKLPAIQSNEETLIFMVDYEENFDQNYCNEVKMLIS